MNGKLPLVCWRLLGGRARSTARRGHTAVSHEYSEVLGLCWRFLWVSLIWFLFSNKVINS